MSKTEVRMPQMGESITEGTVVRWLKAVGDAVERDENILEISTDKVDAEIPSPASGILTEVLVGPGKTVAVGTVLALVDGAAAARSATPQTPQPTQAPVPAPAPAAAPKPASASTHSVGAIVDVIMPQMGESITEGTVVRWLKAVGDAVERDENILEISTDKVDAEIPSPASGLLTGILVEAGKTVGVGTALARIATSAVIAATAGTASPAAAPQTHAAMAVAAPSSMSAARGPSAVPAPGTLAQAQGFQALKPGPDMTAEHLRRHRSTPLVRKIAAEHNIDIATLQGSGLSGRVTRRDIEAYIAAPPAASAPVRPATAAQPRPVTQLQPIAPAAALSSGSGDVVAPVIAMLEGDRVEDMSPMRARIADHMSMSKRVSPHAHTVHEVDFGPALKFRNAVKGRYSERGVNLTITALIAKACVQALLRYPIVNSTVSGHQIVYRGEVNLGVAVALEDGLIVPVVKHAQDLNLMGLARAINDLAERARTKKLKPDEVKGGTFTLTNPGVFGSLFGVPIINQPEVGFFGCGAVKKRVVVNDQDQISIQPQSIFCLSFDHRVVDGAVADHFMVAVREWLLNPNE